MVTLEQIRLLDKKVHEAVTRIDALKKENCGLKSKLETYTNRIHELEKLIEAFKRDQGEIEEGIISALDELNKLEDDVGDTETKESQGSGAPESTVEENPDGTGGSELIDEAIDEPMTSDEESPAPQPEEDEPQSGEGDSQNEEPKPQSGELDIF